MKPLTTRQYRPKVRIKSVVLNFLMNIFLAFSLFAAVSFDAVCCVFSWRVLSWEYWIYNEWSLTTSITWFFFLRVRKAHRHARAFSFLRGTQAIQDNMMFLYLCQTQYLWEGEVISKTLTQSWRKHFDLPNACIYTTQIIQCLTKKQTKVLFALKWS